MVRPGSIKRFEQLFLASLVVSIAAVMLNYGTLRSQAIAQGSSPAGPIAGIFLALLIGLPLWYFTARRARAIAKWIIVAATAIDMITLPWTYREAFAVSTSYSILNVITFVLNLSATALLFTRESVAWFKSRGKMASVDPDIFS